MKLRHLMEAIVVHVACTVKVKEGARAGVSPHSRHVEHYIRASRLGRLGTHRETCWRPEFTEGEEGNVADVGLRTDGRNAPKSVVNACPCHRWTLVSLTRVLMRKPC